MLSHLKTVTWQYLANQAWYHRSAGQNGLKSSKMIKIAKNCQNGLKSSRMVQNGKKWSKWSKILKNGALDLKQARRTGLSARKAWRTKSRGPKVLQLEVGAWRALRFLVFYRAFPYTARSIRTWWTTNSKPHLIINVASIQKATWRWELHSECGGRILPFCYFWLLVLLHFDWIVPAPTKKTEQR